MYESPRVRDAETGKVIIDLAEMDKRHVAHRRGGRGIFVLPPKNSAQRFLRMEPGQNELELELKVLADVVCWLLLLHQPFLKDYYFLSQTKDCLSFHYHRSKLGMVRTPSGESFAVADL